MCGSPLRPMVLRVAADSDLHKLQHPSLLPPAPSARVPTPRTPAVRGKNKLPMVESKDTFTSVGCPGARTYIQSGNVVFDAALDLVERVPELVTQAISRRFGFSPDVIVRSSTELRQVAASNPFDTSGDPRLLHVAFLENTPSAEAVSRIDPERSPQDAFAVRGRSVYLHYPNGVAGSKLTNEYLAAQLQTASTMRNWRTVLALLEMVDAP